MKVQIVVVKFAGSIFYGTRKTVNAILFLYRTVSHWRHLCSVSVDCCIVCSQMTALTNDHYMYQLTTTNHSYFYVCTQMARLTHMQLFVVQFK